MSATACTTNPPRGWWGRRLAPAARRARLALGLLAGLAAVAALPASAFAQSAEVQGLVEQVKRLQRELNTLQRYVYKGEELPAGALAEAYSGEGDVGPTQAARLELRLSQLEAEMRALTGQLEEQGFRIDRLSQRVDKLVADIDLRLRRLEGEAGGQPLASRSDAGGQTGGQAQAGTQPSEPGTLGTVSEEAVAGVRAEAVEQGTATSGGDAGAAATSGGELAYAFPSETPQDMYNHAFGLLSQANYAEAEQALRAFLQRHPDHQLAGNAKYWLGETHYVRGEYQAAAVAFAEGYQDYPDSSKAPDNLLKLGKSLAALGETTDACGTYGELLRRFPDAAPTLRRQADQERQRLSCP